MDDYTLVSPIQAVHPYIAGSFVAADRRPQHAVHSPVHGQWLATVVHATVADVDRAVDAAQKALDRDAPWSDYNGAQRRDILLAISDAVRTHREELAQLESLNGGKPIDDALLEMDDVIECFRWYAGAADRLHGRIMSTGGRTAGHVMQQYTIRRPAGICAMVVSFNYPLMLAAWKLAPALACGNAVIIKPGIQTPLSTLRLAQLIGHLLPTGVLAVLPGDAAVGQAIAEHPRINRISFTGSTLVGREILRATAGSNLKRCTLELGGKAAMIVMDDADMERALMDVFDMAFSNAGQNCCAGTRLLLHAPIHDAFLERLASFAQSISLGVKPGCRMGPLIDTRQGERVRGYIARALEDPQQQQGKLLCGGLTLNDAQTSQLPAGYIGVPPTIFHQVPDDSVLAVEEIFGPVLAVLAPFRTLEEAIDRANATPYGLGAAIWTRSLTSAERAVRELRAGTVWVNHCNTLYPYLPFGGIGQSGFGKDLGDEAMDEFCDIKTATMLLE